MGVLPSIDSALSGIVKTLNTQQGWINQIKSIPNVTKHISSHQVSAFADIAKALNAQQGWVNQIKSISNVTKHISSHQVSAFADIAKTLNEQQGWINQIKSISNVTKYISSHQVSNFVEISKTINSQQSWYKQIAESLKTFQPEIKYTSTTISIDGENFSEKEINEIVHIYILDDNSIWKATRESKDDDKIKTQIGNIPKPVRWILDVILKMYFAAFLLTITANTPFYPDTLFRQIVHQRKTEIRQIKKVSSSNQVQLLIPYSFVNTEKLPVHVGSKLNTRIIAVLSYPCEVNILRFKYKKKWALIEWDDSSGTKKKGWVLARYILRVKLPRNNDNR